MISVRISLVRSHQVPYDRTTRKVQLSQTKSIVICISFLIELLFIHTQLKICLMLDYFSHCTYDQSPLKY
jgi:hypothetical protein